MEWIVEWVVKWMVDFFEVALGPRVDGFYRARVGIGGRSVEWSRGGAEWSGVELSGDCGVEWGVE